MGVTPSPYRVKQRSLAAWEPHNVVRKIYTALLRFDGEPRSALPTARAHVRQWVSRPWGGWPRNRRATEGSFRSEDEAIVRWRTLDGEAARLWEIRIDEAFPDDPSMRQETLIQVGDDAGDAFAFVQISLRATSGVLTGQVVYENSAPEIVPTLVAEVPCRDGGRRLAAEAWAITRAQEESFVDVLTAPSRRIPVLLLIADPTFSGPQADAVAGALAGLAHVAVIDRDRFTSMLERTRIDVAPGAAAYLWWAASEHGNRLRPQWFRADALAPSQWGLPAWQVIRTVFGVAAFRLSPPPLAGQLEAETAARRIRSLEQRAARQTDDAELFQAWEADLVELEQIKRDMAYLELENDRLQDNLSGLLAAFDLAVSDAVQRADPSPGEPVDAPSSLAEAVKLAADQCDALEVLPEAIRSAEAWQFARPGTVLAALMTLNDLVLAWRKDELDGPFMVAARSAGLPWRPAISRTAQTRYKDDYVRRFGDREIMLGPHLAWGNSPDNALRIYVHLGRETRTLIVGHAGRHLRDTSNPHL